MPDFDSNDLNSTLTALRNDTERVGLANAADVRRRGDRRTQRTVAATGFTAALCLVAAAIGFGGLGDGNKKALTPPAEQPALSERSLLLADELTPTYGPGARTWRVSENGEGEPARRITPCQQSSLADLGADGVRHRTFESGTGEGHPEMTQIVAGFPSADMATKAATTIRRWLDSCAGLVDPIAWHKPHVVGSGRVETAFLVLAADEFTAQNQLVSVGVAGSAMTIVARTSTEQVDGERIKLSESDLAGDPLAGEMAFAIQRLEGTRRTTANAVPEDFGFVTTQEEAEAASPHSVKTFVPSYLGTGWMTGVCGDGYELPTSQNSARTGMRTERTDYEARPGEWLRHERTVQLAVHADSSAARIEAEELRSEIAACIARDGGTTQPVTTQGAAGGETIEITTSFHAKDAIIGAAGARAVTVVQRGNTVFVASAYAPVTVEKEGGAELTETVRDAVRREVENNVTSACEVGNCSE